MVRGTADEPPDTVHLTRPEPPPPLADPLHWVTVAEVVDPIGLHITVGWVPPPVPDPMHWSTVSPVVDVPVGTSLITVTLHVTLLPPPFTTPLHWLTEVTSRFDVVVVVVQNAGGSTPAAARQAVAVTVEDDDPTEVVELTMSIVQETWRPAPVG